MRNPEAGLTLIEVLGAVALLGILYTVLAGSAIDGLRSEGESRRRLAASLLADERMAAIEISLGSGAAPPLGSSGEEVDGFTVETEVRGFERPPRDDAARAPSEPVSLAARRAAAALEDAPSLFDAPATPTTPPALRTIEVVVRWQEGIHERSVRRTTYALDAQAVGAVFESVADVRPPADAAKPGQAATGSSRRSRQEATPPLPDFRIPSLDAGGGTP